MTMLNQVQLLLRVSRPLSWVIAPTIWYAGLVHSGTHVTPTVRGMFFAVALSFPLCLITFGVNDVYDYESDTKNKRKDNRWTDGTALDPMHHTYILKAAKVSTALVVLLALPALVVSPRLIYYILPLLCLTWAYSVPPLRLKEKPIFDSLCNGMICWLFWACGHSFSGDTSLISELFSKHGRLIFLYGSALHSMAAMVDAQADSHANYRTIATVQGERFAAIFSMTCFFLASCTVKLRSDVGIAILAGTITSVILILAPFIKHTLVRLAFLGSYLGSLVWVLKAAIKIHLGQNISGW